MTATTEHSCGVNIGYIYIEAYCIRERLKTHCSGGIRETALRDGSKNTKTLTVAPEGSTTPAPEGNTREPLVAAPAPTPADAYGA